MPDIPCVKRVTGVDAKGGLIPSAGCIEYNADMVSSPRDLAATLMHETHHYLQYKEIFSTMSVKDLALKIAINGARNNSELFENNKQMKEFISDLTKKYTEQYKAAGWERVAKKYPRNLNPNSPEYKRAMELSNSAANYTNEGNAYFKNALEREAYDVSVKTSFEMEHSILNHITAEEKSIANDIYDILKPDDLAEIPQAFELLKKINVKPLDLIHAIRQAATIGVKDPIEIIELLIC